MIKEYTFDELWSRLPDSVRKNMSKCEQDPIWHPEGTADIHTRLVFEYAKRNFNDNNMLLSAIFHDLGKPETIIIKEINGIRKISNIGHERKCDFFIDKYINLFDDLNPNIDKIKEICNNHMRAHLYNDNKIKNPTKIKNFESLEYFKDIINFSVCDSNGK